MRLAAKGHFKSAEPCLAAQLANELAAETRIGRKSKGLCALWTPPGPVGSLVCLLAASRSGGEGRLYHCRPGPQWDLGSSDRCA